MLEQYFLKPGTVAQIRSSWLGEPIERYVTWLSSQGYSPDYIRSRVPILRQFAQFTWSQGVRTFAALPEQVEPFVAHRMAGREAGRSAERIRRLRDAPGVLSSTLLPCWSRRLSNEVGHESHAIRF